MDYEQKYNAALERAKEMCAMPTDKATMEYIFPELKEGEGERIRKDIIRVLKGQISFTSEKENEKYIAWLEKQGHMLDPDKVIEWLRKNTCAACWDNPNEGVSQRIEQFKKDFEL